ncbi:DUF2127 domain-containing protein [Synechococcus sp. MIT S1220]|uniref:DUF2127 domain-containing protein n=1 Tax=Synechococcus sp. MIT S1220 TaxID=3082549 RepID=UPI0039AFA4B7
MQGLLIRMIVIKKVVVATLLVSLSLAALWGSSHTAGLARLADALGEADRRLLAGLARRALDLGPEALRGVAAVMGSYALLVYVAAWATWTDRRWGDWLFVVLLALPLPYEVLECFHTKSPSDAAVLGLTVIGLLVVLRRARRPERLKQRAP